MNIFILDENKKLSAQYNVDRHVVKMILEQSQLLCGVHHISGGKDIPYKLTHKNHPSAKWSRASLSNYLWLCDYTMEICYEYTYRYEKIHKSQRVVEWCKDNLPEIPDIGLTPFAQALPDDLKDKDPIKAYRNYYIRDKKHLFSWKKREVPLWIRKY